MNKASSFSLYMDFKCMRFCLGEDPMCWNDVLGGLSRLFYGHFTPTTTATNCMLLWICLVFSSALQCAILSHVFVALPFEFPVRNNISASRTFLCLGGSSARLLSESETNYPLCLTVCWSQIRVCFYWRWDVQGRSWDHCDNRSPLCSYMQCIFVAAAVQHNAISFSVVTLRWWHCCKQKLNVMSERLFCGLLIISDVSYWGIQWIKSTLVCTAIRLLKLFRVTFPNDL